MPSRWSDAERIAVYRHVFGAPGGSSGDVQSNRDFAQLWLRFVASVAQFSRQGASLDRLQVASRDFAAAALPRIDSAWSHRDMWLTIDRVATDELGGAAGTERQRSLAQAGAEVLEWVAAHRDAIDATHGSDHALADSVEQWLAVTVSHDADVATCAAPGAASGRLAEWSRALFATLGVDTAVTTAQGGAPRRLAAFFDGAAGTGKTLAAHWLATALGRDVQRIDLSQVVSKYIGETEKNLERVFADAQHSDAVLLFDEGDALFGRRTEVHDAHDRYANVEVNALLQRIEKHDGIAIVTTSVSPHIDPDLLKQARATLVAFPLPPR